MQVPPEVTIRDVIEGITVTEQNVYLRTLLLEGDVLDDGKSTECAEYNGSSI